MPSKKNVCSNCQYKGFNSICGKSIDCMNVGEFKKLFGSGIGQLCPHEDVWRYIPHFRKYYKYIKRLPKDYVFHPGNIIRLPIIDTCTYKQYYETNS